MFVGPFFYFKKEFCGVSGLYADLMPVGEASDDGFFINHLLSHSDFFDRLSTDIEYSRIPRGRVLFDIVKDTYMIYIDPKIEEHVPEIAALFQIEKYEVGYDEHYTTKRVVN